MRVQTTSLPKRCLGGKGSDYRLIDFSVEFNPTPTPIKRLFTSQEEFDAVACKPNKAHDSVVEAKMISNKISNMHSQYYEDIIGVAVDGVLIKGSTND